MAKKCQHVAVIGRGRIMTSKTDYLLGDKRKRSVDKGYCVVYTADENRFVLPLAYPNHDIFQSLLTMSEEEFGLPTDGPITLPCDMVFMKFVISAVRSHVSTDLEKALLASISTGRSNIMNPRSLLKMARKWHEVVVIGRGRIMLSRTGDIADDKRNKSVVDKGYVAVYTADENRFIVPLTYLNHDIFRELLRLSEKEFGLPRDGPITLSCDMVFMKYIVSLVQSRVSKDLEKAVLSTISSGRCLSSFQMEHSSQQLLFHAF
ncbi:hypothetical protein GIB67_007008 [Kingdonia uniflora]|uniref:Uncharacterized protein n=1 Tax=Kingdonia uniflora TaxID=39325 RepID=A0A7J7NZ73_9MAGN|nr:hypothetical protein GIB67_007008 [Kingdonia uniflora]